MEQLERLADYLKDAMLLSIKNYEFDLLMGYQVQTDEAGHEFTLVDPRQKTFQDSAKRQRYAEYLERSYQIADRNLKEIIEAAKKTNIIAVSEHGMAPMHTQGFPNRILRAADLLSVTGTASSTRPRVRQTPLLSAGPPIFTSICKDASPLELFPLSSMKICKSRSKTPSRLSEIRLPTSASSTSF